MNGPSGVTNVKSEVFRLNQHFQKRHKTPKVTEAVKSIISANTSNQSLCHLHGFAVPKPLDWDDMMEHGDDRTGTLMGNRALSAKNQNAGTIDMLDSAIEDLIVIRRYFKNMSEICEGIESQCLPYVKEERLKKPRLF
jgi:hypothetical protein